MGSVQPGLLEGGACAGQPEPGSEHAVLVQCVSRRMESSPQTVQMVWEIFEMADLWDGRDRALHFRGQLSFPNIFP